MRKGILISQVESYPRLLAWARQVAAYAERWDGGNRHYKGVPDWQSDDLLTGMGTLTDGP
jgi:hypothetical protein